MQNGSRPAWALVRAFFIQRARLIRVVQTAESFCKSLAMTRGTCRSRIRTTLSELSKQRRPVPLLKYSTNVAGARGGRSWERTLGTDGDRWAPRGRHWLRTLPGLEPTLP